MVVTQELHSLFLRILFSPFMLCRPKADAEQPGQDAPRDPELDPGADQRSGHPGAGLATITVLFC